MIHLLRADERVPVPWKNGSGVTREVAVRPPGSALDQFDWRLSIAEVRAGGPFSSFPGIERSLVVLQGCLSLSIGDGPATRITAGSAPVRFAGDVPAFAEPLGGAVTDLNVMTRRGRFSARVTRHLVPGSTTLVLHPGTTVLLALSRLRIRCRATDAALVELDALLIEGEARCDIIAASGAAAYYVIEISADLPSR